MKFNGYIVQLEHKDTGFTGIMTLSESSEDGTGTVESNVSANFKRIARDLFIANFKKQVEFRFKEKITLKNRNKDFTVLLPVITKFNKRKLTRISKFLSPNAGDIRADEIDEGIEDEPDMDLPDSPGTDHEDDAPADIVYKKPATPEQEKTGLILNLLNIEKFIKVEELVDFFQFEREFITDFLVEKEIAQEIKIITGSGLLIISRRNIDEYISDLSTFLTNCHTTRTKSVKLPELAADIKLPVSSLFFRYLVRRLAPNYSFKVSNDKIVFQHIPLSESEKGHLDEIESALHERKRTVFSIDNLMKFTGHEYDLVNDSLWVLIEAGKVIQLNDKYFIFTDDLGKFTNKLKTYKRNQGETIDIPALRELTQLSRRHLIALFEYYDVQEITLRENNHRKILISV